eukprot:21683_1
MTTKFGTILNILKREKIKLGIGISIIGLSFLVRYIFFKYKRFKYDIDSFTRSITNDLCNIQIKQRNTIFNPKYSIHFPAQYTSNIHSFVGLNCLSNNKIIHSQSNIYTIPAVDEYFGDINFLQNIFFYGKYSNGILSYSFNENTQPQYKTNWIDIHQTHDYFQHIIGYPLYDLKNINNNWFQNKQIKLLFNTWNDLNITNNSNSILTSLLSDLFTSDNKDDYWITLIAFCGYGCHRTCPMRPTDKHPNIYFVNDILFLGEYNVRNGFENYGAAAYFNKRYKLEEIKLFHDNSEIIFIIIDGFMHNITDNNIIIPLEISKLCYKYHGFGNIFKVPNVEDGTGSTIYEWNHAKWAWKVSLSVAIFLIDMLSHCHFRESTGLMKAIRNNLNENHPIRRLLLPFTFGTVQKNRIFNEYLRENGLYHRCFAFKYKELQRLIRDSMCDLQNILSGEIRKEKDKMKYKFRLIRKKVSVMKRLPDEIYPIYNDIWSYWTHT